MTIYQTVAQTPSHSTAAKIRANTRGELSLMQYVTQRIQTFDQGFTEFLRVSILLKFWRGIIDHQKWMDTVHDKPAYNTLWHEITAPSREEETLYPIPKPSSTTGPNPGNDKSVALCKHKEGSNRTSEYDGVCRKRTSGENEMSHTNKANILKRQGVNI